MLDFLHLPPTFRGNVQLFNPTSGTNLVGFQQWQKPRGASMVEMIAIAGGGGGGGGFTRTAGSAGGGGGSGASSGIARFICPALFLPDVLYVQVGGGGVGGAASAAGTAGLNSYVLTAKTAVLPNMVCYSGANAPGGGGGGTGAAGGAAGAVPTIAVTQPCNTWGRWFAIVGLVGVIGGAQTGANGGTITAWAAQVLSPGASGAGCTTTDFAGGNQTATALLDIGNQGYFTTGAGVVAAGGTGGTGVNVHGGGGVERLTPFFNSGGAGGGSNNVGQAGHGGSGGYGCGGGGGGAGATGGRGGNGGDGVVIIIAW